VISSATVRLLTVLQEGHKMATNYSKGHLVSEYNSLSQHHISIHIIKAVKMEKNKVETSQEFTSVTSMKLVLAE